MKNIRYLKRRCTITKEELEMDNYWSFDQTPFYNAKQVSISKTEDGEIIAAVVKKDGKEEILVSKQQFNEVSMSKGITEEMAVWYTEGKYIYDDNKGSIFIGKSLDKEDKRFWFSQLYVKDKYRHQGIGTSLIKRAIKYCKLNGIKEVYLWCTRDLITFYSYFGFTCNNETTDTYILMKLLII